MPIDTIGQLNLQAAENKAQSELDRAQSLKDLGSNIGGSINTALESVEKLKTKEVDMQKQKEFDGLLKSGSSGVQAYAQELGIEDPTVYLKMAESIKDPKQFVNIYQIMRKKADVTASAKKRSGILGEVQDQIKAMNESGDFSNADMVQSRINELAADPNTPPDVAKELNVVGDNVRRSVGSREAKAAAAVSKQRAAAAKQRNSDEKRLEATMRTAILGGRGGQKVFGAAINKVVATMDGLDTIKGIDEGDIVDTQQIASELGAIITNVLASGGASTKDDRENMTPKSLGGTIKDTVQYISGKPQDAVSKDLLDQLKHMLDRERKFWNDRLMKNNDQLFFAVRPIIERQDIEGRFVNKDLARDWSDLMEVLSERGEFITPKTDDTHKRANISKAPVQAPASNSGDISAEQFQNELNNLFPE